MQRLFGVLVLVGVIAAACTGSATPQPPASPTTPSASATVRTSTPTPTVAPTDTPQPTDTTAPGTMTQSGTLIVTIGKVHKTYAITSCASKSGYVAIAAGDPKTDGISVVISKNKPVMSGKLDGKAWTAASKGASATSKDNTGTFKSTTVTTNLKISGSYTCQ